VDLPWRLERRGCRSRLRARLPFPPGCQLSSGKEVWCALPRVEYSIREMIRMSFFSQRWLVGSSCKSAFELEHEAICKWGK